MSTEPLLYPPRYSPHASYTRVGTGLTSCPGRRSAESGRRVPGKNASCWRRWDGRTDRHGARTDTGRVSGAVSSAVPRTWCLVRCLMLDAWRLVPGARCPPGTASRFKCPAGLRLPAPSGVPSPRPLAPDRPQGQVEPGAGPSLRAQQSPPLHRRFWGCARGHGRAWGWSASPRLGGRN